MKKIVPKRGKIIIVIIILLCIEEAHGKAVRFFSPRCHIMPYYAKIGACPMTNIGMTFTFR